jgi:phosphoglycerate dehydrogenase-like enzyme
MIKILSQVNFDGFAASIEAQHPGVELRFASDVSDNFQPQLLVADPANTEQLALLLQRFPSVEWVHVFAGNAWDFPSQLVGERKLTCSQGATAVSVGEWVMAALLYRARNFADSFVQSAAGWHQHSSAGLHGKRLGLIGFGRVGVAIASRASNFGMKVNAFTRREDITIPGVFPATTLEQLIENADHLVVAEALQAEPECLVDDALLAKAKPGLHLVNVARGSMVDLAAVKRALATQQLSAATLDVHSEQPLPAGHWAYQHPNVAISPNVAWRDPAGLMRMQQILLMNIRRFIAGEVLVKQVLHGQANP